MKLRAALVAVAAVGACFAPQASAKGSAGVFHEVTAKLGFTSAGATFEVDVVARINEAGPSAAPAQVAVTITRCVGQRCDAPVTFTSAASAGDVTVAPDLTSAKLNVPLFGRALALTWDEVQAGPLPGSHVDTAHRSYLDAYRVVSAHGSVAGRKCQTDEGTVAVGAGADPSEAALPTALPTKAPTKLQPLLSATCAYAREIDT